jgi:hypothetical protein
VVVPVIVGLMVVDGAGVAGGVAAVGVCAHRRVSTSGRILADGSLPRGGP